MRANTRRRSAPRVTVPLTDNVSAVNVVKEPNKQPGEREYTYEITKSFRNYLSYPVVLIDRNNLSVRLPSQKRVTGETNALVIDVRMTFSDDVQVDVTHVLDRLKDNAPAELHMVKQALNNNRVSISYGRRRIVLTYRVEEFVLRRNDWQAHISELDTVICRAGYEEGVVHPYSEPGQVAIVNHQDDVELFSYRVLINDPFEEFGSRYVNINNLVYYVPVTIDPSIKPGVYIYAKSIHDNDTVYHSFEEADDIVPLFHTAKLAEQLGNPMEHNKRRIEEMQVAHKRELLTKEHELTILKSKIKEDELRRDTEHSNKMHDLKILEAEYKRLEAEYKEKVTIETRRLNEQKAAQEAEANLRAAELNRLKHELEMRGYARKDASEWVKWLPALISGLGALFSLMKKIN